MSHQQEESKEFRKWHIGEMEQSDSEQESIYFHEIDTINPILSNRISLCQRGEKACSYQIYQIAIKLLKCAEELPWETVEEVMWWTSECIHWWALWQSSEEIEQEQTNASALTSIFEIVPSRADG